MKHQEMTTAAAESAATEHLNYGSAILAAFEYLLDNYPDVFIMGQGLWAPWYVGNSMTDLDKKYGTDRIMDGPVSELGCTGAAIGASLCGFRPVVIHPRVDFMILAADQIINQAAKWSHMFGGQDCAPVTIRGILNRGGEQGAQHSQALHAWFAHVPGLRVVMPATVADARDLLVASVLCDDPVVYIDDRWLYSLEDDLPEVTELDLASQRPVVRRRGTDVTLVASSYSTQQCLDAAQTLSSRGVSCEVVDLRIVNPLVLDPIVASVRKTGRLCAVDGGWRSCGLAGEIIAGVAECVPPQTLHAAPVRVTLPDAPAPTSRPLEADYYSTCDDIIGAVAGLFHPCYDRQTS